MTKWLLEETTYCVSFRKHALHSTHMPYLFIETTSELYLKQKAYTENWWTIKTLYVYNACSVLTLFPTAYWVVGPHAKNQKKSQKLSKILRF